MSDFIKMVDLKSLSIDELQSTLVDYKKKLFDIRFNRAVKSLNDTSLTKKYKKSIARIYTKITQVKNSNI